MALHRMHLCMLPMIAPQVLSMKDLYTVDGDLTLCYGGRRGRRGSRRGELTLHVAKDKLIKVNDRGGCAGIYKIPEDDFSHMLGEQDWMLKIARPGEAKGMEREITFFTESQRGEIEYEGDEFVTYIGPIKNKHKNVVGYIMEDVGKGFIEPGHLKVNGSQRLDGILDTGYELTEKNQQQIFRRGLVALHKLHRRRVGNFDTKAANFVVPYTLDDDSEKTYHFAEMKLIDPGLAMRFSEPRGMVESDEWDVTLGHWMNISRHQCDGVDALSSTEEIMHTYVARAVAYYLKIQDDNAQCMKLKNYLRANKRVVKGMWTLVMQTDDYIQFAKTMFHVVVGELPFDKAHFGNHSEQEKKFILDSLNSFGQVQIEKGGRSDFLQMADMDSMNCRSSNEDFNSTTLERGLEEFKDPEIKSFVEGFLSFDTFTYYRDLCSPTLISPKQRQFIENMRVQIL